MIRFVYSFYAAAVIVSLLTSCKGVKPSSAGGGGLIQIFVKGRDSLLCHAGPIQYNSEQGGERFEIDHTYLKVKGHRNNVVCNFSLFTKDPTFKPTEVTVRLKDKQIHVASLTMFFAEGHGKKKYHYRYSFSVSDVEFRDWMLDASPVIDVGGKHFTGKKGFRTASEATYRRILFDAF